jgi:hypothetical protein
VDVEDDLFVVPVKPAHRRRGGHNRPRQRGRDGKRPERRAAR